MSTASSPHTPDTAAYQRFVPAFRQALQQTGMQSELLQKLMGLNERMWQACCSYDGRQSCITIRDCALEAYNPMFLGNRTQYFLVVLLLRRTLIAANMHSYLIVFLKQQHSITDTCQECIMLLVLMIGSLPDDIEKVCVG